MTENPEEFDIEFDTEKFIDEIKSRPAIWNCESKEYTSRDEKKKSWDEIIYIFGGESLTATQRRMLHITLHKKWKGIRGCFTRELRRQGHVRAGVDPGARKSEYTHFRQLAFLRSVVNTKASTSTEEPLPSDTAAPSAVKRENALHEDFLIDDDSSEDYSKQELLDDMSNVYAKLDEAGELEKQDPLKEDIKRLRLKKPRIDSVPEDEDLLFLLSMLRTLQRVPVKNKMSTKIKLMAALEEATRDVES